MGKIRRLKTPAEMEEDNIVDEARADASAPDDASAQKVATDPVDAPPAQAQPANIRRCSEFEMRPYRTGHIRYWQCSWEYYGGDDGVRRRRLGSRSRTLRD